MRRFFFAAVLAGIVTPGAWAQGKQAGAAAAGTKTSEAGAAATSSQSAGSKTSQAAAAATGSQSAGSKTSQAAVAATGSQSTGSKTSQAAVAATGSQATGSKTSQAAVAATGSQSAGSKTSQAGTAAASSQTKAVNNAGQRKTLEMFDRGGIPANPTTGVERDLMQRITRHQSGDLDGAARIQRDLAGYYRSRGDYTRARAAEERAAGYYGGMPMMVAPQRAQEEGPPAFGNVPAPVNAKDEGAIDVPVYQPAEPALPLPAAETPAPEAPAPAAAAAPPAEAPPLAGRFRMLQGRTLHMWDFRPDGTFEHGWSTADGTGPAVMETGTYSVNGPYVTLFVARRAGTAGRSQRRMRFETRGAEGILLDGRALRPALP